MRVYKTILFCLLLSLTFFNSCKKQSPAPEFHYEYFDLSAGRYIEYDVMEIDHDVTSFTPHDTSYYQLRTLIGDTVIDNEGRVARKFIRYTRDNASASWQLKDIWTALIVSNRAEVIEENQRVIKLVFAPTITKEWNPNSFNSYPAQNYYYSDIHDAKSINSFNFDSTLVVVQEDNEPNLIEHKRQFEVYAKGIGLVRKYFKDLTIANFDTLNVQQGKELFYTCIGYGFQ